MKAMRRILIFAIVALWVVGFGVGCRNPFIRFNAANPRSLSNYTISDEPPPVGEPRIPLSIELLAGKTQHAGEVGVRLEGNCLKVQYSTTCSLVETHLHIAVDPTGFPQTHSGNPITGQFEYTMIHDPGTTNYTYSVDLDGFENTTTLYFAAHAEVERGDDDGTVIREGAWADGYEFPGANWATYFGVSIPPLNKPTLHWTHYDHEDGLSTYPSQTTFQRSFTAPVSARGFTDIPLEGGVECEAIKVKKTGSYYTIWAATMDPLVYSRVDEDIWHFPDPKQIPDLSTGIRGIEQIKIDDNGTIWMGDNSHVLCTSDDGYSFDLAFRCTGQTVAGHDIQCMEVGGDYVWVALRRGGNLVKIHTSTLQSVIYHVTGERLWSVLPASDGSVYIATDSGLYVSATGEPPFTEFYSTPISEPEHLLMVEAGGSIWTSFDDKVLELSTSGEVLWRSPEEGENRIRAIRKMMNWQEVVCMLSFETGYYEVVYIDTNYENDVGRIPTEFQILSDHGDFDVVGESYDEDPTIYLSIPGCVAVTTNLGGNWQYKAFNFSSVAEIDGFNGNIWAGLWGGGIAKLQAGSEHWQSLGYTDIVYTIYAHSEQNVLFGTGDVLYTLNGGDSFGTYDFNLDHCDVMSFCEGPNTELYLAINSEAWVGAPEEDSYIYAYQSTNSGQSWSDQETVWHGEFARHPDIVYDPSRGILRVTTEQGLFCRPIEGGGWVPDAVSGLCYDAFVDRFDNFHMLRATEGPQWTYYIYTNKAGETGWDQRYVSDAHKDSEIFVDEDGDIWLTTFNGLKYLPNGGTEWYTYDTLNNDLVSDYVTSVYVEGSGAAKTVWIGTVFGASKGTF